MRNVIVLLVILSSTLLLSQAAALDLPSATSVKECPNLESILCQLTQANDTKSFAEQHDLYLQDNMTRVIIELTNKSASIPTHYNVTVETRHENLVQALAPIDELLPLSRENNVTFIRTPRTPIPATDNPTITTPTATPTPSSGLNLAFSSLLALLAVLFLKRNQNEP